MISFETQQILFLLRIFVAHETNLPKLIALKHIFLHRVMKKIEVRGVKLQIHLSSMKQNCVNALMFSRIKIRLPLDENKRTKKHWKQKL